MTEEEMIENLKDAKPALLIPAENPANHLHVVCTIDDLKKALESLIKGWNDYEFTIEWSEKTNG